jgi:hypothetical protein
MGRSSRSSHCGRSDDHYIKTSTSYQIGRYNDMPRGEPSSSGQYRTTVLHLDEHDPLRWPSKNGPIPIGQISKRGAETLTPRNHFVVTSRPSFITITQTKRVPSLGYRLPLEGKDHPCSQAECIFSSRNGRDSFAQLSGKVL